jgi:uncharacterized protein
LIVFDASTVVGAALKADSVPERALLRAEATDIFALSIQVDDEIAQVLGRPKFADVLSFERREHILITIRGMAVWFVPSERVTDCREPKDNRYLELALAAGATFIVSSDDDDLIVLHPWRGVSIVSPAAYLALPT